MDIKKLEQVLTGLGLSTECETTQRSKELKSRLRAHLHPESGGQTSENSSSGLDFLKFGAVLKRIPKGSRPKAARVLTQILERIVQKNDKASWLKLFQFARSCLGGTKRGGKKNKSHATIVNKRLETFTGAAPQITPTTNQNPPQQSIRLRVAAKMAAADISGAVKLLASNDTVLQPSEDVVNKLKDKHPDRHRDSVIPDRSDTESILVGREDVKRSIESFPPGSSGGPDGLLPQHLKDMTADSLGEPAYKLVDALVEFYNKVVLCDKVPDEISPVFYGANLTALSKPDNGVRPIAVGFSLRRMASKMLMCKVTGKCETLLRPHQLGVGTPKGAEAAVHAIRAYIKSPNISDKVLLKIDFKNAFNQVRRDVILNLVKEETPEIYQYVYINVIQQCLVYILAAILKMDVSSSLKRGSNKETPLVHSYLV